MSYPEAQCLNSLEKCASKIDGELSVRAYRKIKTEEDPSVRTIQNKFGTWNDAKQKIELETTAATQPVDTEYFEEMDDETSYWLGFIIADAYVAEKQFKLKISKKDKEHLEKFKQDISAGHVIYEDDSGMGGVSVSMTIGRHDFTKKLYSIVGKEKTFSDSIPDIPKEYWNSFVRGIYDGDGTIKHEDSARIIGIVGHVPRLENIDEMIPFEVNVKNNKNHPTENHGYLHCTGDEAEKIINWMYPQGEETEPKLDRKYPSWA